MADVTARGQTIAMVTKRKSPTLTANAGDDRVSPFY
jgi:hypothetical protein